MKFLLAFFFCCTFHGSSFAQPAKDTTATKTPLDSINRVVDRAVVKKDLGTLQTFYADDFLFLHATGRIDNKTSWMKSVGNPNSQTLSREHDSVVVELHNNVALLSGILSVRFPPNTREGYAIRYIRVYAWRKDGWQLLSHHSTAQWTIAN